MSSSQDPAVGISLFRRRSFWVIIGLVAVLGVVQIRMNQAQAQRLEAVKQRSSGLFGQLESRQLDANSSALNPVDSASRYPNPYADTSLLATVPQSDFAVPNRASTGYARSKTSFQRLQGNDKLSIRIRELVLQLRGQPEDKRSPELKDELEKLITQQFEQRHQSQQERLDKVLADAKATEIALQRREEQKDEIISRRLLELLGSSDPLNWDYQPIGSSYSPMSQSYSPPSAFGPGRLAAPPLASYGYYSNSAPQSPSPGQQPSALTPSGPPAGLPGLAQSARQPARAALPPAANNRWAEAPTGQFSAEPPSAGTNMVPSFPQPKPNQASRTDEFLKNGPNSWFASAGDAVNAKEIISSGYQLKKGLLKLAGRGAIGSAEVAELEDSVNEAQTIWDFQKRDLASRIEVAHIELEAAKEKLESLKRIPKKTNSTETQTYEARKELMVAESETQSLVELLSWMESFEKSLQDASVEEGQATQGEEEQDKEASSESSDSEAAPATGSAAR